MSVDSPPPESALIMRDALHVDISASAQAYRALHLNWEEHVSREAARLASSCDLIVVDVPYLPLAAASRAGIPALALCSLNWLDIYAAYCGDQPEAPSIMSQIECAYRSAICFVQPQPHWPMPILPNRRSVGPIARIGQFRQNQLRALIGVSGKERLILVTLGGLPAGIRLHLPDIDGIHWIIASGVTVECNKFSQANRIPMSFIDLLASCDAVLTKVGYATFVEAACNGVGIISLRRPDWPETAVLSQWAMRNANFAWIEDPEDAKAIVAGVSAVLSVPRRTVSPVGTAAAVSIINETLNI